MQSSVSIALGVNPAIIASKIIAKIIIISSHVTGVE